MDGIHDLGGKQGFGPVEREENEPVFHERWEAGVFTMTGGAMLAGVIGNQDQFRHAIERIDPVAYLTHTYYGRWLGGLETLLVEAGVIRTTDLDERVAVRGGDPADLIAARPNPAFGRLRPSQLPGAERSIDAPAAFSVGQLVETRAASPSGHTRLPAYARGRIGRIVAHQGVWVFPDSNAHGFGEDPEHLYCVRFSGEELWGAEAEPGQSVHLDLFESYLSKVEPNDD
jgi:nitrile hydratase beta subunit